MARPSVLLMFAGTTAVLVALFLLWQSTRSDDSVATTTQPVQRANEPSSAPAPTTSSPTAARVPKAPSPTTGFAGSRPAPSLTPSPAVVATPEERAPEPGKNLQFGAPQLHAQTRAVEPLVRECVEKAAITGARPTGTATLTYIVARRGDKLQIEDTGIDNEKTTIEHEGLLDCLHQTAKAMKFEGLPRDANEIYAARRVTLENGKITEYKHVTFSYLR